MLDEVEVADMEPLEAIYIFQWYAKRTEEEPDVTREVDETVRENGYWALAITVVGSYVSVTARFENHNPGAARLLSLLSETTTLSRQSFLFSEQ